MVLSNIIVDNLKAVLEGKPWYGASISDILDRVSYNELNNRIHQDSPTIAQYLSHLVVWKIFILKKLQGDTDFDIQLGSPEDWPHYETHSEEDFTELTSYLKNATVQIISIIERWPNEQWDTTVPGKEYNFEYALNGLIQHDAYHLGQIAMIVKYGKS